jgi:hypothetical protein
MGDRDATDGSRGASFEGLIYGITSGSYFTSGGYDSYQSSSQFVNADKHYGIAGVFGDSGTGGQGPFGLVTTVAGVNLRRDPGHNGSMWQQATTGTRVTSDATLTYAAGQSQTAYGDSSSNVLNIRSSVWYRGVDVETADLVTGSLETIDIGGTDRSVFYG